MEKVIKEILGQIPKFVISFIDLVQSPKKFVKNTVSLGSENISDASIFLGISLVITYLIKSPHFAKIKDFDVFTYILKDGLWKLTIVILISISLSLTWRILKRNISTIQFFIINSYFFGVFSIFVHAIFVMSNVLNESNPNISIALLVIGYLFVVVWGLISFRAYIQIQEDNKMNFTKSRLSQIRAERFQAFTTNKLNGKLSIPKMVI